MRCGMRMLASIADDRLRCMLACRLLPEKF
jgi:hypothetical protein